MPFIQALSLLTFGGTGSFWRNLMWNLLYSCWCSSFSKIASREHRHLSTVQWLKSSKVSLGFTTAIAESRSAIKLQKILVWQRSCGMLVKGWLERAGKIKTDDVILHVVCLCTTCTFFYLLFDLLPRDPWPVGMTSILVPKRFFLVTTFHCLNWIYIVIEFDWVG